jgi:hypothetical protein
MKKERHMKVFILGTGKSGTTALVFRVAAGLPNCKAFSGGHPGKHAGGFDNAVYKHTYEERKGKSFQLYMEHLEKERYDRKIWMARDPRDVAVSRMLYRWHKGCSGHKRQYRTHLERVQQKETDPRSIPFYEILAYTTHGDIWPVSREDVFMEEKIRYERMSEFVRQLGKEWFIFKYEDMIAGAYEGLNRYLGFAVQPETEVPTSTGKAKVVRKKASGDWRQWFTEEDVALFKPAYLPYMQAIGYDCGDWALDPAPRIEPQFSSQYMENLIRQNPANKLKTIKEALLKRFF